MNFNFKSVIEFLDYFKDEDTCLDVFEKIRFKDGYNCPHCKHNDVYKFKNRRLYKCKKCHKKFSAKVGTIFESSKIPLKKWFLAAYLLTSAKKGISSVQMANQLGVTQKTAWYMVHRLRQILFNENMDFSGVIEIDETYIGGKESNKPKHKRIPNTQGRSLKSKTAIVGIINRENETRRKTITAFKVDNVKGKTIRELIKTVDRNVTIYTDEFRGYNSLSKEFNHQQVNHSIKEWVNGDVHTNNIENFWSLFKRGYLGIYHWMSKKHLQLYINEFSFRYNYKKDYLEELLSRSIGKTLSYKELTNG